MLSFRPLPLSPIARAVRWRRSLAIGAQAQHPAGDETGQKRFDYLPVLVVSSTSSPRTPVRRLPAKHLQV